MIWVRIGQTMKSLIVLLTLLTLNPCFAAVNVPGYWIDPSQPAIEDPDRLVDAFLESGGSWRTDDIRAHPRAGDDQSHSGRIRLRPLEPQDQTQDPRHAQGSTHAADHPGCRILCISAEMEDGRIVEIESHLWIEP
jgi:hypothetical protein